MVNLRLECAVTRGHSLTRLALQMQTAVKMDREINQFSASDKLALRLLERSLHFTLFTSSRAFSNTCKENSTLKFLQS